MGPNDHNATWLCPTAEDRVRLLDMERRLGPMRVLTFGSLGLALLSAVPWVGIWPLPLLALALVGFLVAAKAPIGAGAPEYRIALAWLVSVAVITVGCLETGGVHSPVAPWLAIPVLALAVRFRVRGVAAGSAIGAIVVVLMAIFSDTRVPRLPTWLLVVALFALMAANIGYMLTLLGSDVHHRSEATVDPLTGMLNRNALNARVEELAEQGRVNGQPLAVIVGDIDHFKAVNDEHGHSRGDAVLGEVAYRLRRSLRAYDLAYRLGGEEFLVLLPGGDRASARAIAEELRAAVAGEPVAGVDCTMSFGVTASSDGTFDFPQLFSEADEALYVAKQQGRNRVEVAAEQAAHLRAAAA
jgi:diguanylate cyclase (GGDEF)-like protein